MTGEQAVLNLLAIKQSAKFEEWFDDLMDDAIKCAVWAIAERDKIDLDNLAKKEL